MKRRLFLALAASATIAGTRAADGDVILEVSGNVESRRQFSLKQLQALGVTQIETSTPWTTGTQVFEGVLGRTVLDVIGPIASDHVRAHALNDYQADIPVSDFYDFDILFAWSMNGALMSRRDKGPLWIVYPRDSTAQLREERYEHRWVWQLNRLFVP
jgi:hypothetical protein